MAKTKAKAVPIPKSLAEFIELLRQLVVEALSIRKIDDELQQELVKLKAEQKRLKAEATAKKEPHESRIKALFAAIRKYFEAKADELLTPGIKSWVCEYARVGTRLTGPSIKYTKKVSEISEWLTRRKWGWDFLDSKVSKKKLHANLPLARRVDGVVVEEQHDAFYVEIEDGALEFVDGKLRSTKEQEEDNEEHDSD